MRSDGIGSRAGTRKPHLSWRHGENRSSLRPLVQATLPGMSVRGWGGAVGTASGIAAGAAAAQAGLGYGLGVIAWLPPAGGADETAWVASLTWAVWIAATSTVAGAIGAARLAAVATTTDPAARFAGAAQPSGSRGWLWRWVVGAAAALGGALSIALVAVPAREATGVVSEAQQAAAGYALGGVALGLLLAIWALSVPAVARNLVITVAWIWALAVATVVAAAVTGRLPANAPLGGWPDWAARSDLWFRGLIFWPAAALSLGSALVIGAVAAWSLARHTHLRVGATISGAVGPSLAAAAHLIAPLPDGTVPEQVSANLVAPYAVIAGLAGSALVAGLAQRRTARTDLAGIGTTGIGAVDVAAPGIGAADTSTTDIPSVETEPIDPAAESIRRIPDQVAVEDGDRRAEGDTHRAPGPDTSGHSTTGSGPTGTVPDQRSSSDERE